MLSVQTPLHHQPGIQPVFKNRHNTEVGPQAEHGVSFLDYPAACGIGTLIMGAGQDRRVFLESQFPGRPL
ncbi:hypothetical protein ES703_125755 [subsurface metagenome]